MIRLLQLIFVPFLVMSGCLSLQEKDASYIKDSETKDPQVEVTESESLDFTESSFSEIKNSAFNDTSPNPDGGNTLMWIATNGGV